MTFTSVTPYDPNAAKEDRVFVPLKRCRNRLLIVRPIKYQAEGFVTTNAPDGTDVVFADFALLDALPEAENELGDKFPAFAAGTQFRDQAVLARYLIGTFKRYVGHTLIGTVFFGPATKGNPPIMWQDLAGDPASVQRGQQFLAAHPEFLIPVEAQIVPATAPPFDPTAAALAPIPGTQMAAEVWAQSSAPTVVSGPPAQLSTLEQMRAAQAGASNSQGQPPF